MIEPFKIVGVPKTNGVLIVVDHASNHVPRNVDLGISLEYYDDHIAYDIGTAEVAQYMTDDSNFLAVLGGVSRLVVDLNRYPDEEAVIPVHSDGVEITNNILDEVARIERIQKYYDPYHKRVAKLIRDLEPRLVLSLHSFSPTLRTNPQLERPWDIGVLYNEIEEPSKLALQYLNGRPLKVGDQLPYSGKELNATMNRQAEVIQQLYFGVELRQDLISFDTGQRRFADILKDTCNNVLSGLA